MSVFKIGFLSIQVNLGYSPTSFHFESSLLNMGGSWTNQILHLYIWINQQAPSTSVAFFPCVHLVSKKEVVS